MRREDIYAIGYPAKEAYLPFIEFVAKYADHHDKILDLGGGEGAYSLELNKCGFNAVNVDVNKGYIKISKDKEVESEIMDATSLGFKDKSFDVVLLFETLEHIPDCERIISEAKRIARKRILLTVPNCGGLENLKKLRVTYDHFLATDHVNFFTKDDLQMLLSNYFARFKVEEIEPMYISVPQLQFLQPTLYRLYRWKLVKPLAYYRLYAVAEID